MTKSRIIISLAFVAGLASCDMDRMSPDSIPLDQAFQDMASIESLERGTYSRLRTAYSPSSMIAPDIQADYVNAVDGFTNTYGELYQWNYSYDDSDVETTWNNFYGTISQCNFVLDGIRTSLGFEPDEDQQAALDEIRGRMHLVRAISYSVLAERFCADYEPSTAGNPATGLPLVISYDTSYKPERSTLAKVYETIVSDLGQARKLLSDVKGTPDGEVLNIDCVTAMEAHVYLQMHNYSEAMAKANALIGSELYPLSKTKEEFASMWVNDSSDEIIFKFYASVNELAYQFGYYFYQDYFNGTGDYHTMTPDYIPTQACVDMYDDADWRKSAYMMYCDMPSDFGNMTDMTDGYYMMIKGNTMFADQAYIISKYPGNPELQTTVSFNYFNAWKPFRIAEMYLIAAEAALLDEAGGDAATPLNELRKHRGLPALEGEVTLKDVQDERYREMLMEGTRLTDLKRWKIGITRSKEQAQDGNVGPTAMGGWSTSYDYVANVGLDLSVQPDDYRFVWPIPASEIFASPQLEPQQNPGWRR